MANTGLRALLAKYGWKFQAIKVVDTLRTTFDRGEPQQPFAIRLVLSEAERQNGTHRAIRTGSVTR